MDPVQKLWFYEIWLADQKDEAELAKNQAYLIGSFWNPEAVKSLMGDGNSHQSTDAEFEESTRMVKEGNIGLAKNEEKIIPRRRRKLKG